MIPHCRLAFWRISWFIYLRYVGNMDMLNVERSVGVGGNSGQTVLEDDLYNLMVFATVTDPLIIQIFYNFHGFFLLSFYLWYYQNDTRYGRIYSNIAISFYLRIFMCGGKRSMAELNFSMLRWNIRSLLKKHGITQAELATISGMNQSNVSKALSDKDPKEFTLDQVYRISQHFGISIDELVGNTAAKDAETSPRAALAFFTKLLCDSKLRYTTVTVPEWVYELEFDTFGPPEYVGREKNVEYHAFYFPKYLHREDFFRNPLLTEDDAHDVFRTDGNDSRLQQLNEILDKFLPMVKLYRETEIPDEAFQMVLNGYLEQLPEK